MAATRAIAAALLLLAWAGAQAREAYVNVTTGGPLRAGVYGRIEVRQGPPPPLLSSQPLVAAKTLGPPPPQDPLYFYLPAGQVRKWSTYCQRYHACERPVYFVRVDNTPGKLGRWKSRSKAGGDEATRLASGAAGL